MKNVPNSLQTLTIAFDQRIYTREFIEDITLLHYKSLGIPNQTTTAFATESSLSDMCNFAEIVVTYKDDDQQNSADITSSTFDCESLIQNLE